MKNIKSKKELEKDSIKLYGGLNKNKNIFKPGDKLRQIYTLNDNDEVVEGGKGEFTFIRYKGDLMIIKPLNQEGLYGTDTVNQDIINMAKGRGFIPNMDNELQLHYMYADRYKLIN